MDGTFTIGGIKTNKCEKKSGYIDIAKMADGTDLKIPVYILNGVKNGPTLCLLGTEHGDETLAMDIIKAILDETKQEHLSGQIVALPFVNPLSFETQSYHTPHDMKDVHVLFPGDIGGSLSEKMAYILAKEIIDYVDYILNIHGGGTHQVADFIYVPGFGEEVSKKSLKLAKVFGQEVLYLGPAREFVATSYAARARGVPGIIPEIGTDLMWTQEVEKYVEIGVRGVKNVMKYLGMIKGKIQQPNRQILIKNRTTIKTRHGGMFYPEFGLEGIGKILPNGTFLGRTINPLTFEEVERFTTPYEQGILFLIRGRGRVHPGDYMFHIGDMKTAEIII